MHFQAVEIQNPPAHEFVFRANIPGARPPLTVPGIPTDSRLIITLPDGTTITEVVAEVPAGTGTVQLTPGVVPGPSSLGPLLRFAGNPATANLVIDGQRFSLTDPAHFQAVERIGRVMITARFARSLGNFGHAVWWISAHDDQLDFALLWHRAIPGPDVLFSSARLETFPGAAWTPALPDPACAPPYLVKPDPRGQHIIPQQMCHPFWFSIHRVGVVPEPEIIGVADWSDGGWMPSGFPIPDMPPTNWGAELSQARSRLINLQPVRAWDPDPVSFLWPSVGVFTSGEGGGTGRSPIDGVRWAASRGPREALELWRIGFLREMARARIRLDPDSSPLDLPADGDWSFWDGFQDEGHWAWSSWPRRNGAYDPRLWADHDTASMERRLRYAWVLLWMANDPIAKLITLEGATRARLTFWEGRPLATSWGPGMGSDIGIWQGNAGLAIAPAICLGATEYGPWRQAFLDFLRTTQMPSGCFTARQGGYPSDRAPFFNQYLLQGGQEFVYLQLAAYSLGERDLVRKAAKGMVGLATDDGLHTWGTPKPGLYYFTATGFRESWIPRTRFLDASEWPWGLEADMGEDPLGASYYSAWHMGHGVALALATGAPEAQELLRRFLVVGTGPLPANPIGLLNSWGLEAPDDQSNTPIEQWAPLKGILQ